MMLIGDFTSIRDFTSSCTLASCLFKKCMPLLASLSSCYVLVAPQNWVSKSENFMGKNSKRIICKLYRYVSKTQPSKSLLKINSVPLWINNIPNTQNVCGCEFCNIYFLKFAKTYSVSYVRLVCQEHWSKYQCISYRYCML